MTGFSESTISYATRSIPERLLSGNGSGGESPNENHVDRYWSKKASVGQGKCQDKVLEGRLLATEVKKGRNCGRRHLSHFQATMLDWRRWLQPRSVWEIRIYDFADS